MLSSHLEPGDNVLYVNTLMSISGTVLYQYGSQVRWRDDRGVERTTIRGLLAYQPTQQDLQRRCAVIRQSWTPLDYYQRTATAFRSRPVVYGA